MSLKYSAKDLLKRKALLDKEKVESAAQLIIQRTNELFVKLDRVLSIVQYNMFEEGLLSYPVLDQKGVDGGINFYFGDGGIFRVASSRDPENFFTLDLPSGKKKIPYFSLLFQDPNSFVDGWTFSNNKLFILLKEIDEKGFEFYVENDNLVFRIKKFDNE